MTTRRRLLFKCLIAAVTALALARIVTRARVHDAAAVEWFDPGPDAHVPGPVPQVARRIPEPYVELGRWRGNRFHDARVESPEAMGFRDGFWEPGAAGRWDWLLQDSGSGTWVLGGSVALGYPAKGQEWWRALGWSCAAMLSWCSTQERVALELAVIPKHPTRIVCLDGLNDFYNPVYLGARPQDPWAWHTRFMPPGVDEHWIERRWNERLDAIARDPARLRDYVAAVVTPYVASTRAIKDRCREAGIRFASFLQPWAPLTRARLGTPETDLRERVLHLCYDETRRQMPEQIDLAGLYDEHADEYVDMGHLSAAGQVRLAAAIKAATPD